MTSYKNQTASINAYFPAEQSCQISPRSDLKRRSYCLFWGASPQQDRQISVVCVWSGMLVTFLSLFIFYFQLFVAYLLCLWQKINLRWCNNDYAAAAAGEDEDDDDDYDIIIIIREWCTYMYAQRTHSQHSHINSERDPSRDHDVTTDNDVISDDSKVAGTSPPTSERPPSSTTASTQNYIASAYRIIIITIISLLWIWYLSAFSII